MSGKHRELAKLRTKGATGPDVDELVTRLQRFFAAPGERECSPDQAEQRAGDLWGAPSA